MELQDLFGRSGGEPLPNNMGSLRMPYNIPAVDPRVRMLLSQQFPDAAGWVYRDDPNKIYLNSGMKNITQQFPQVLPHEYEHVLQNRVKDRYNQSYKASVLDELSRYTGKKFGDSADTLSKSLGKSAGDMSIPEYMASKYQYPIAYFGRSKQDSLVEQWAELSAAEQMLKKDLTQDPFIRDKIFQNNQKLIDTYKGTTGLRMDRYDARDLPPMTAQPGLPGMFR